MKQIFYSFILLFLLASCSSSKKDFLANSDKDKSLYDAVKALSKHPKDSNAINALPVLYNLAKERHLKKIEIYSEDNSLARWDKIIDEYSILQKMYDAIYDEPNAYKWVSPSSYQKIMDDTKELAANAYYNEADLFLKQEGRDNAKKAWTYFKKSDKYIPGFKDAKARMGDAFKAGTINVVINSIQDRSSYFNTGWGSSSYTYSNEYFLQTLIRELGGNNGKYYPALFYNEWDARRENISPDWAVDLSLRYLDIPRPSYNSQQRRVSRDVEVGRDSSGHILYGSVSATIYVTRQSVTARAQIDVEITELGTRKNILRTTYSDEYSWQEETATYSGDSRALSSTDWDMLNRANFNTQPTRDEVLTELYRRLYPQVKNGIGYAIDW